MYDMTAPQKWGQTALISTCWLVDVINPAFSIIMDGTWAKLNSESTFSHYVCLNAFCGKLGFNQLFDYIVKQHDWQLSHTHDWLSGCIKRTSRPQIHPLVATPQTLAPNVQDDSVRIWDILASCLDRGKKMACVVYLYTIYAHKL